MARHLNNKTTACWRFTPGPGVTRQWAMVAAQSLSGYGDGSSPKAQGQQTRSSGQGSKLRLSRWQVRDATDERLSMRGRGRGRWRFVHVSQRDVSSLVDLVFVILRVSRTNQCKSLKSLGHRRRRQFPHPGPLSVGRRAVGLMVARGSQGAQGCQGNHS